MQIFDRSDMLEKRRMFEGRTVSGAISPEESMFLEIRI